MPVYYKALEKTFLLLILSENAIDQPLRSKYATLKIELQEHNIKGIIFI